MKTEIYGQNNHYYTFDHDTELITMDGVIVPYREYQPVYSRAVMEDSNVPPTFMGIMDVLNNKVINTSGKVSTLVNDSNEITI
jgi:hypothetical protein